MLEILLLLSVLCVDSFIASLSYGMSRIKIPFSSAITISLVGTALLSLSLFLAQIMSGLLPSDICRAVGVTLLLFLGLNSIFSNLLKAFVQKRQRQLAFKYGGIDFVLSLYLDETVADLDNSKVLSIREALILGAALSLDSLVTGFSVGLSVTHKPLVVVLSFAFGLFSVVMGQLLGGRLGAAKKPQLPFLSGVVLIMLAIIRLL